MLVVNRLLCGLAVFLCIFAVSASAQTNTTGFRATFTTTGFNDITDTLIPLINSLFQTITIPDMSFDEHVSVIGHITLDLTNIEIRDFSIEAASLVPAAPNALTLGVSKINVQIAADYKWRRVHSPHTSDHGTITATPEDGDITLALDLLVKDGKPSCTVVTSVCDFSHFDIHFKGKVDWLYNLFTSLFSSTITKAANSAVAGVMEGLVTDQLNAFLLTIPTIETFGGGLTTVKVDLSTNSIDATADLLTLENRAVIYNNLTGEVCPHAPVALPVVDGNNSAGIQFAISETFLTCPLWSDTNNKALNFALPSNSTQWTTYIPQIQETFPNALLDCEFELIQEPTVSMTQADGVTGKFLYNVSFDLVNDDPTVVQKACILQLSVTSGIDLEVVTKNDSLSYITGSVGSLMLHIDVIESWVGDIDASALKTVTTIIGPAVKLIINTIIGSGFAIPTGLGIEIEDPLIDINDGYIVLGCSLAFDPATPAALGAKQNELLRLQQQAVVDGLFSRTAPSKKVVYDLKPEVCGHLNTADSCTKSTQTVNGNDCYWCINQCIADSACADVAQVSS